jgi:nicotinamidase-related amidase
MNAIVDFRAHLGPRPAPTLVFVDLCQENLPVCCSGQEIVATLENCRSALKHARRRGCPIAFVRRAPPFVLFEHDVPLWIPGFMPRRSEMVFDRHTDSCFSSPAFEERMKDTSFFVLAGLSAETVGLATALDAYLRKQRCIFLADAFLFSAPQQDTRVHGQNVFTSTLTKFAQVAQTQALLDDALLPQGAGDGS